MIDSPVKCGQLFEDVRNFSDRSHRRLVLVLSVDHLNAYEQGWARTVDLETKAIVWCSMVALERDDFWKRMF